MPAKDYNNYMNQYMKDRFIKLKLKAIEFLGGVCLDCKSLFHYSVFEFHHLDPEEKEFVWTKLRNQRWSTVEKELKKCALLCANCHRLRHYNNN